MSRDQFSEPETLADGSTVIYVSRPTRQGESRPIGMYTVANGATTWTPAVDAGRAALIGASTGFVAALLGTIAVVRRPPWPDLTERAMTAIQAAKGRATD
ncbi:hypothetical protein [Gordonia insulae]|uniref:Uncharacterized protein n=1 Tax=Gordonia insulae TaxID=2420509 RepID=A0A3G8JNV8_9ACTN|nr:hypothetical protein [Gordonia insulae]AZG46673.1 hypothetical protein D7316_03274 [Gordonia insulae]